MGGKHKEEEKPVEAPLWVLTFADLMSQLMAYFVFLTSMSSVDTGKIGDLLMSTENAFKFTISMPKIFTPVRGYKDEKIEVDVPTEGGHDFDVPVESTQTEVASQLKQKERLLGFTGAIAKAADTSVNIMLPYHVYFSEGSGYVQSQVRPILFEIATLLAKIDNPILIQGHTDDGEKISKEFPSDWELSMARAMGVADFLMETAHFPSDRIYVSGRSHFSPLDPNQAEGRHERNQRVDIIILTKKDPIYGRKGKG